MTIISLQQVVQGKPGMFFRQNIQANILNTYTIFFCQLFGQYDMIRKVISQEGLGRLLRYQTVSGRFGSL